MDLAEGILRALCLQALGQVINFFWRNLADKQLACFIIRLNASDRINYVMEQL